jgi:hypothetical protein
MNIFKGLFQKKESSCCDISIVEVKNDEKATTENTKKK